ncbi:hypothetical protein OY671_007969, partial [Metschnikowia pulcherrima]
STFSIDVDTGAYANVRRFSSQGQMPPKDAVRTEESINYFRYDYPSPEKREAPFSVTTDVAVTPWNPDTRSSRVGSRGYDSPRASRPPANSVFSVDVSGSMSDPDKSPSVKSASAGSADESGEKDRVSSVVYAGAAGMVSEPTNDKAKIRAALDRSNAGGSTAGGAGSQSAYQVARGSFIDGGVSRISSATDGDFNVGQSSDDESKTSIEDERKSGVFSSVFGFGEGNYNDQMMQVSAQNGNGTAAYIDTSAEAEKTSVQEATSTSFPIAKDVKIQVEFNPATVAEYRSIGYETRALKREDFNNDRIDAGEIGSGHTVTAVYEITPKNSPAVSTDDSRYAKPNAATDDAKAGS